MAAPSARKAAPKETTAAKVPVKRRVHIPSLATLSADMRTLVLNLCLMVIILIMIPVIGLQFLQAPVIIDTFSVPPSLATRGMTPDVAANRLSDALLALQVQAGSSKEGLTAIPKNQRVDFQIPDAGISIDSLVYYVRQFFHLYQTRIGGEFVCADVECRPAEMSLRVRIMREKLEVVQMPPMGAQGEDAYFRAAALRVLTLQDPFLAAAVDVQTNPEAGLAQAERLVRLGGPDAIWAHNLIGNTRMTLGQTDAAIAAFQAALKIDPGFVIAQTNLGSALVAKQDFAGAAKVFDAVARTHPGDRFLAVGRYRLALAQGQTAAAIEQALKADAADPGKAMYLAMAGQAAFGANDMQAARGYLQRALDVAPDDDLAVTLMSLIHQLAAEYEPSHLVLQRALAVSPDHVEFLTSDARVLGQLHRFDAALVQVDKALAVAPQDAGARKVRAATLYGLGRHQEALVQLATLEPASGTDPEIALMQGQSLAALGQKDAARDAYDRAIAGGADGPYAMMAKAYLQMLEVSP